jgi:riboflavin biosynthesis pyrimidine reductase
MYERLDLPVLPDRPYFFTNFVSTLDGKVEVPARHAEYWPIGSARDHTELMNLRVNADALIHGRGTALAVGRITAGRLSQPEFRESRRARGKPADLLYIVVSNHPDQELRRALANDAGIEPVVMGGADLPALARELKIRGVDAALMEGGARLAASFFAAGLIDEIFLTLAPKVFAGGSGGKGEGPATLTMAEGPLLPPDKVGGWKLVSAAPVEDEVFLRYRQARHGASTT